MSLDENIDEQEKKMKKMMKMKAIKTSKPRTKNKRKG